MLGNYDECLQVEDITSEAGKFSGKHCMVSVGKSSIYTERNLIRKLEAGIEINEPFPNGLVLGPAGLQHLLTNLSFTWSVCIPSSCSARDLELHLRSTMRGGLDNMPISVTEEGCSSRTETTTLTTSDWIAVCLLCLYVCVLASSTSYDLVFPQLKPGRDIRRAFSLNAHYADLLKIKPPSVCNLSVLDGVRALTALWIVVAHRIVFSMVAPATNHAIFQQYLQDWKFPIFADAKIAVDSFLLLSGLLVCYNYLKPNGLDQKMNIVLRYLRRYVRLTILYAVMIPVSSLALYMGDGPFWKANMLANRVNCENNLLYGLLYISNYFPYTDMCLPQTWSTAVDMQLYWLSPLILYPLWKWPNVGKALLGVLILVGISINFLISYLNEYRIVHLIGSDVARNLYLSTHARFIPWVMGVGLGYILHTTRNSPPRLSRGAVAAGWFLSAVLMIATIQMTQHFLQADYEYDRLTSSIYVSLKRPAFALGLAWVIFACVTGYGGWINSLLLWRGFQLLSRISYSLLFTHTAEMMFFFSKVKTPQYISEIGLITEFTRDVLISVAAAAGVHLIIEMPRAYIESIIVDIVYPKEKQKNKET